VEGPYPTLRERAVFRPITSSGVAAVRESGRIATVCFWGLRSLPQHLFPSGERCCLNPGQRSGMLLGTRSSRATFVRWLKSESSSCRDDYAERCEALNDNQVSQ
jgi:hypothetical protein